MPKPNVRHQLLDAGLDVLHRQGFNGTSIQDITQAAKVPKGSFYNHFKSKEALGAEIVQVYSRESRERLAALRAPGQPALQRVREHFRSLCEMIVDQGLCRGCLLGNFGAELAGGNPLIRQQLHGAFQAWERALRKTLAEAQQEGDVDDDLSPEELAAFLINAWEGSVMRVKVEQDTAPLDTFLIVTLEKLLRRAGAR